MIDMGAIAAAVTGLKAATDLTKSFIDLKSAGEIQGKVVELQTIILAAQGSALAAQSDQFTLLDKVRQLEAHIASLEAWETEKKRYELKEIGRSAFAYILKPDEGKTEPMHPICANCYGKNTKSILQFNGKMMTAEQSFDCPSCKTKFGITNREMMEALGTKN